MIFIILGSAISALYLYQLWRRHVHASACPQDAAVALSCLIMGWIHLTGQAIAWIAGVTTPIAWPAWTLGVLISLLGVAVHGILHLRDRMRLYLAVRARWTSEIMYLRNGDLRTMTHALRRVADIACMWDTTSLAHGLLFGHPPSDPILDRLERRHLRSLGIEPDGIRERIRRLRTRETINQIPAFLP